ncbi:MAG TPA: glycosyltransferase [Gemmatimonadales bacterium]|nr:glycosyltransferase [Gemmatimonadales bacterium]
MHVALYTHSRLPVRGYGGTQRVVVWLARGLAQLGHRVTLIAPAGSAVPEASLIALDPREVIRPGFDVSPHVPADADLLHAHTPLTTAPQQPHVFTLHGNRRMWEPATPNTIFLSRDHARRHGGAAFVYNGVDPADFVYREEKAAYDLFLGRLHSAKGYRWAIEGAKLADKRLVVAGGWRPSVRPSLRFVGSVDGQRKAALLANAQCLWMPALWDEPFGLTLVEGMMSGTPVLGTRRGALPEVVSSETGALGDTLEDLVRLRATIDRLDPAACRARAERWFSHLRMAQEYVRMYRHYLETSSVPEGRVIQPNG